MILDFWAEWCAPCEELETFTFSDPRVIQALEPLVKLKVDLTDYESENSRRLREQFGVGGVPEIHFLDGSGKEISEARVMGFVPPERFLLHLEYVRRVGRLK